MNSQASIYSMPRSSGLDIIRTLAILFVNAVPLVFLSSYGAAYVKSKIIK